MLNGRDRAEVKMKVTPFFHPRALIHAHSRGRCSVLFGNAIEKNGKVKFLNNTAHPETQVTLVLLNNITSFILSDAGFNG